MPQNTAVKSDFSPERPQGPHRGLAWSTGLLDAGVRSTSDPLPGDFLGPQDHSGNMMLGPKAWGSRL